MIWYDNEFTSLPPSVWIKISSSQCVNDPSWAYNFPASNPSTIVGFCTFNDRCKIFLVCYNEVKIITLSILSTTIQGISSTSRFQWLLAFEPSHSLWGEKRDRAVNEQMLPLPSNGCTQYASKGAAPTSTPQGWLVTHPRQQSDHCFLVSGLMPRPG